MDKFKIYENYKQLRFLKVAKESKLPIEQEWQNKPYTFEEILPWIKQGNNYGVLTGFWNLIIIDADDPETIIAVTKNLPETLSIKTHRGIQYYYCCPGVTSKILLEKGKKDDNTLIHYGEVLSRGNFGMGAGSKHPKGSIYEIASNKPIITITEEQLNSAIKPLRKDVNTSEEKILNESKKQSSSEINAIPITNIIDHSKFKKMHNGEFNGSNPWHGSSTGANTWINPTMNLIYCFRCNTAVNSAKAIALNAKIINNCSDSLTAEQFLEVLKIAKTKYGLKDRERSINASTFIFNEDDIIQEVNFTFCKFENDIAIGLLLPRQITKTDKQGKIIKTTQEWTPALITSNPKIIPVDNIFEEKYKLKFKVMPDNFNLRWRLSDIEKYLKHTAQIINAAELHSQIKNIYEKYIYFPNNIWYDIHALWDLGTYFFQLFESYPLFELRGLMETGKSKIMSISSNITFNAFKEIMINPSEAVLFRVTHSTRGTKYIDECEKLFKLTNKGMEQDNRIEVINSSYKNGSSVPRMEKMQNKFIAVYYDTYSPTMIGSINGITGATESRAIIHTTTRAPSDEKRGNFEVSQESKNTWLKLRNNCYLLLLQNWKTIKDIYDTLENLTNLRNRDFEIWKPLLALSIFIDNSSKDSNLQSRVLSFAEKLANIRKIDMIHEDSYDYYLLEAVLQLLAENEKVRPKDISNKMKSHFPNTTPRKVSGRLDKLGFRELRNRENLGSYFLITRTNYKNIVSSLNPDLAFKADTMPVQEKLAESNKEDKEKIQSDEQNNAAKIQQEKVSISNKIREELNIKK